eukprot:13478939-Heterocapsa_arctica.AAC.1
MGVSKPGLARGTFPVSILAQARSPGCLFCLGFVCLWMYRRCAGGLVCSSLYALATSSTLATTLLAAR